MNIALILSGGTGSRVGLNIPKQYVEVKGKPIIYYGLQPFLEHSAIDAICIVADQAWQDYIVEKLGQEEMGETYHKDFHKKFRGFSLPGATRQLSIFNGLKDIIRWAASEDCIMIHDAARPMLTGKLISECLAALQGHDGVMPVLPMKDTVYFSKDGSRVSELLDRSKIFAGQAPEVFRLASYYKANERLLPEKILQINGSTEPAIMAGLDIAMIPGSEDNFKITTEMDLKRFQKMMLEE